MRKPAWSFADRRHPQKLPPPTLLSAVLVESIRIDGKPRQRIVRYLGSIRDNDLGEAGHRNWFWRSVERNLDELSLPDAERAAIEAKLAAIAPRATADELEAHRMVLAQLEQGIAASGRSA